MASSSASLALAAQETLRKPATAAVAPKGKFHALSDRFQGFEEELHLTRDKKTVDEQKRLNELEIKMNHLNSALALEANNRAQSLAALQAWLTDRIAEWAVAVERPMLEKLDALSSKVETVAARVEAAHQKFDAERLKFPPMIDERCAELLTEIRDLKIVVQQHKLTHDESDKRIVTALQDQGNKLSDQISADKHMLERKLDVLRQDVAAETEARIKTDGAIKGTIQEEFVAIKASIAQETQAREEADEELTQALNHYTAALQDAIKIVSGSQ